ncbi:MAG: hypothetical protein J6Z34_01970 [Clostridia bacterium]|nr:hypothetical protein [Clostridia bacterium]
MNELDYAEMIEIPVATSEVTVKKARKFRRKRVETLKKDLMEAVNGKTEESGYGLSEDSVAIENAFPETVEIITKKKEKNRKRKDFFKVDVIAAQVAVIIVLVLTIMLTNIFWQDSGINTLVRSVFRSGEAVESDVSYTRFTPAVNASGVTLDEGVMIFSAGGSIYSPCDGKIVKVAENADKLDITIRYSPSFSAVISGAEYAYYGLGDSVYRSVPVCYSSGEVRIYLYDNGKLLTDYALDNGKIVWQS